MADIESRPRSPSLSPPNTPSFPPISAPPAVNDPLPFNTYFVPYGPGVWEPYQPLTLNHNVTKPSTTPTTDQMFKNHGLPINLLVLNERDRMAISFGFEQRGILLAQAEITQRRYRQQLALHRIHELEMEKQDVEMQQQIRQAERTLDVAVIEALQRVLIFFPPDPIARESDAPLDMPDDWVDRMMTMGRVI